MAKLTHEIWEELDEHGNVLPGVCLAGPDGEGFRKLMISDVGDSNLQVQPIRFRLVVEEPTNVVTAVSERNVGHGAVA